jgi:dipeptidyl aminopeptidase/acylaminoacyl peptidase
MPAWSAERYGPEEAASLILLVHGGQWRSDVDASTTRPLAQALASEFDAFVWNLEYPRTGMSGGGWPGTARAVEDAVDAALIAAAERRVALVGHSAGGQLALLAARDRPLSRVFALAPATDLLSAARADPGGGAIRDFLGADAEADPALYEEASPLTRLPIGAPMTLIHGSADDRVPITQSREFAAAALAAGDECELHELHGVGHMEVISPDGPAWPVLRSALRDALSARRTNPQSEGRQA